MVEITPIRPAPPIGNVRPIGDAAFAASFAECITTLAEPSAFGKMSSPRRAILECLVKYHPAVPTAAELRLCSGLNQAALKEHLQALRWKGWLMFESHAFSPLTEAELIKDGILVAPVNDLVSDRGEFSGCAPATAQPEKPEKLFAKIGKITLKSAENSTTKHEIAAVIMPEPQQGRDGVSTEPPRDAVPATNQKAGAPLETLPRPKPAAKKARRVAAPVPAHSKTAGTGAISLVKESDDPTLRRHATPMLPVHLPENGSGPALPFKRTPEPVFAAPKPPAPTGSNWIAERFAKINGAIAFLKTKSVRVEVAYKDAPVKTYLIDGKRDNKFAEEVVELAISMGWAG